ncbi:hypothetical protein DPMN_191569 [Dreissena polymorpha]|uniref:Uncharacterized protein n=2 Tax=Dreissena polymorpha TaxID=45954 RepID=A0A9D3Y5A4_DREPO|nr:hypothetical protein DPMN_191569 [Dreissena polymorpha]
MLNIDDDQMSQDIFSCKLTCIPDQRYQLRANDVTTSPSFLVQESYKTVCPEVDNINMPLFNQGVQMYEITAAMPQYRSFSNWRSENNTGCPHLSPYYWDFSNVQIDTDTRPIMQSAKAKLYSTGGKRKDSRISILILISFTLEGKSKGMLDSEMGTILKVRFADVTSPIQVQYQFKGRKPGISLPEPQTVTRTNMAVEWNTDDFSWTDGDYNVIFLQVTSNSTRPLHLEHISLERRPMLPDTIMQVFKGDDTIVEVVFSDFWWTNPDAMTVHIAATGKSYDNVSYFRVYRPIPWSDGYAQVFVLYQDGNARLLPVPPQGLDWIPFGSSVIIGQTDPTVVRPYASITEAFIDETNLKIDLKYMDGGSCKLSIASSLSETRVTVSDIKLSRNPMMYPFATFRSMYVEEGNSDVDSVMVNGVLPHHIMDDFPYLIGRSFVFHRKCMSRHLMLSPDIYIDIRRTDVRETTIEPTNSFQTLIQRIQNHRYRLWTPRLRYTYPRL